MGSTIRVCGMAGSLREASYNRALLRAARELAPASVQVEIFERLGDMPLFNQDVEARGEPEPVGALRKAIREADALLVVTPEYNYNVPGVLKNALDWASRPPKGSVLANKPAAMMGASMGLMGSVRAQMALRQVFLFTDTWVMPKPEVYVARAQEKFDASLRLVDEKTREMVRRLLEAIPAWVQRFR